MKSIVQIIACLAFVLAASNCTTYVNPEGQDTHTTMTRTITDDPQVRGASVTTRQTTTRY